MNTAPLALAMGMDALFGEPPTVVHPVAWVGWAIHLAERLAPRKEGGRLLYGAVIATVLPVLAGAFASTVLGRSHVLLQAALLKCAFAGRALLDASERVETALSAGEVERARRELRWLVSRPTAELDPSLASAAAIESLAENFVDSWLAPLLAYALFGAWGLYAYRAANTADAMWGYRTPRYETLGKAAARLDDVLNYVPARIGAALLVLGSDAPREAWCAWNHEAGKTASPNAGQSMAALAGALGVRLEKANHYVLNPAGAVPQAGDVGRARRVVRRAMCLSAALALVVVAARRENA